jgi:undecaprenyl phosphate-alpha-L-ara4N flippase subunit ArnF
MTNAQHRAGFFNPYFQLGVSALLLTVAEILMKKGAVAGSTSDDWTALVNIGALARSATWVGIALYIVSFVSWLHVLRLMPLTQAYSLINVVQVLVPVAAWLVLHEPISYRRAAGIALVLGGTLLVAAPSARAEEKL